MAYCTNCGNKYTDNAKFCPSCGKEITISREEEHSKKKQAPEEKLQSTQDPTIIDSEVIEDSEGDGYSGCFKIGLRLVFLIIGIVLLLTNPNESKFKQYLFENGSGIGLENILFESLGELDRKNYLLFSIYEVELNIIGVTVQERHIGVFNRFIQLEE